MWFGTNKLIHWTYDMWKAPESSKPRRLPGVNILIFKLFQGFCSDEFAETRRVIMKCCYELIAETGLSEIILSAQFYVKSNFRLCSVKVTFSRTYENQIYNVTCILFFTINGMQKCESFREIECDWEPNLIWN